MPSVRIEALRALAAVIETVVPELVGKVKTGQAPSGTEQTYPTVTIVAPSSLRYDPQQELEHATIGDPADGNVVFNVGSHSGPFQLRLVTTTIGERYELEQKLIDLFLGQERRPGVLIVPVTAIPALSSWISAWELESDGWQDAFAFDRKLESMLVINGIIPALVARAGVYEINDLVSEIDLARDLADPIVPGNVEQVLIDEDGNITPYVPPP